MKNVLPLIESKFPKTSKEMKVTEAFVIDGELYLTSEYEVSIETFNEMEKVALEDEAH